MPPPDGVACRTLRFLAFAANDLPQHGDGRLLLVSKGGDSGLLIALATKRRTTDARREVQKQARNGSLQQRIKG